MTVYVWGDATKELDEAFFLDLLDPAPGLLLGRGRGVIRNDD